MSYAQLYDSIQDHSLHIGRNTIKESVLSITGVNSIKILRTRKFTPDICRGLYLSPRSTQHFLPSTMGQNVIFVAAGQTKCWDRLIVVKELMHLLDGDAEAVDTGETFDKLLSDLFIGSTSGSQSNSEYIAFWRALGVLAPEKIRLQEKENWKKEKAKNNQSADYDVALKFKIPAAYIPFLFSEEYDTEISKILSK